MSQINELQLFKLCLEQPLILNKDLSQLNLQFLKDPKQVYPAGEAQEPAKQQDSPEATQRKAHRLYQMIWSGLTKFVQ